ncbi:MAG: DUF2240 family protein [Euryarchaeota archaeon]|nr:DUF2240 family protein [Euryarchaeota archaeon]
MSQLQNAIAVVFKRKGKSMLSEKEFINTLLFDLRWSNPGSKSPKITAIDSQKILDAGIRTGLLTMNEGALKPAFDYKAIDIPLNYQPSRSILDELALPQAEEAPAAGPKAEEQKPVAIPTADLKPLGVDVPLFSVLLDDMARQTGQKKKDIVAKTNRLQDRLKVCPEVSALIVARDYGLDISKYLVPTRDEILKR